MLDPIDPIPLRISAASNITGIKILRLNRKNNRGLVVNTSTGYSSRDRRDVFNRAVRIAVGNTIPIIRRRLRRGWAMQAALATAA